ncbi:MAG: response regulator [Arenicellales bacterium]
MEPAGAGDEETRVMVVDDDPIILGLLTAGLAEAGYHVDACREAKGALERYVDSTPDVAVLDVGLPDMPGTDLARELLRAEYRPILILSNHNDLDIVRQAVTSGVVGYLVKPLSVEQLIPSLETSLCRYRERRLHVASHLGSDVISTAQLGEVMDRLPFALFIVDSHHHPLYRNARARRLLDDRSLHIDPAGRLRPRTNGTALVSVLNHALGRSVAPHSGAVLLDERPGQRLHAWAAPLATGPQRDGERLAAVAAFDAGRDPAYTFEALRTLYGLTRKETKLVNGLLAGLSLKEYCARNFVTTNTVRTHLKSIHRKTGTHRQAEVVRLFSSMFMPDEG